MNRANAEPAHACRWQKIGVLVASLAITACVGEGYVRYRGTVVEGPASGHSFDDSPKLDAGQPIDGARVNLTFQHSSSKRCSELRSQGVYAITNAEGRFDVAMSYGTVIPNIRNVYVFLCVSAPGYAHYKYRTVRGETDDPRHGEKYLNIRVSRQ